MRKYKIGILLPGSFPVPAVKGGAIETLITSIVKKHNNMSDIDITVFSEYDEKAKRLAEQKYTSVFFRWIYSNNVIIKNIKKFIFLLVRKITRKSLCSLVHYYGAIYKEAKKDNFDLLIIEDGDLNIVKEITSNLSHTKLVYHVHWHCKPEKAVSRYYTNIIAVSKFIADEYMNCCDGTVNDYVLKNAIDIEAFQRHAPISEQKKLRKELGINQNDFLILFVGRIMWEKGIRELMKAILRLNQPDIKLLIIGSVNFAKKKETDYSKEIRSLCNQNKEQFTFTGYIENGELYRYSDIADIQCVPSMCEEAAGLVVLEAMAKGLPTIITNSGGMPEYVTENTSIVIDKDENVVEHLSKAILTLKSDVEKRKKMGEAAKEHVKQYSEEKYYKEFCDIVKDIIESEKSK